MKARINGCNDPFQEVQSINVNGDFYPPEVLEFEIDDNYDYVYTSSNVVDWGKVRIKASIAAMHAILNAKAEEPYKTILWDRLAILSRECADALIKELKGE